MAPLIDGAIFISSNLLLEYCLYRAVITQFVLFNPLLSISKLGNLAHGDIRTGDDMVDQAGYLINRPFLLFMMHFALACLDFSSGAG